MIELIFVIVVIGILTAIALPRFSDSADSAYISKAQSQLAAVRSAITTERQKRILRGDTTKITDLGLSSNGGSSTNAFDHFSADQDGNYSPVLDYPIKNCVNGQRGCWNRVDATHYQFLFSKSGDGTADFKLETTNGKPNLLVCDNDDTDCKRIDY